MITSKLNKLIQKTWYFGKANSNTNVDIGKFKNVANVLPDAVVMDFSVTRGGKTVSAPVEEGGYNTYNKTNELTRISCNICYKGTYSYIQGVLNNIKELKETAVTFSIITPMYEYENMTLESYSYKHEMGTAHGLLQILAEFTEVPLISLTYRGITSEEAKSASAVSAVSTGLTQPKKRKSFLSEFTGRVAK